MKITNNIQKLDEAGLRELKAPWPKTMEELTEFIKSLTEREHDYGTCVYAMSLAANAAFNYVSGVVGSSGFQASCADLDFLKRTRNYTHGFMILDYNKLLYPQFLDKEHFPGIWDCITNNKEELIKAAKELLSTTKDAHPDVIKHWKRIIALEKEN